MSDDDRTLFCGNLSERVTEDLLYELFLQAGPLERVHIPGSKEGRQKNFGFITFKHEESVPYSVALMHGVTLFGRQLKLDPREREKHRHNPYMDMLMNKNYSRSYNDNSSRRHDSRWNEPPNPDNVMFNHPNMQTEFHPFQNQFPPYNNYGGNVGPNRFNMNQNQFGYRY